MVIVPLFTSKSHFLCENVQKTKKFLVDRYEVSTKVVLLHTDRGIANTACRKQN